MNPSIRIRFYWEKVSQFQYIHYYNWLKKLIKNVNTGFIIIKKYISINKKLFISNTYIVYK